MGLFNKKELERIAELEKQVKELEMKNMELDTELIYAKKTVEEIKNGVHEETNNIIEENKRKIEKDMELIMNLNQSINEKELKIESITNDILETTKTLFSVNQNINREKNMIKTLQHKKKELNNGISELEEQLDKLVKTEEDTMKLIDMNGFKFNYHYEESVKYEEQLKQLKEKQKFMMSYDADAFIQLIPSKYDGLGGVVNHFEVEWMWGCDFKKRDRQRRNIDRLLVRAFNNECDNIITNVRYSNIGTCANKIKKSFESMNKFTKMLGTELTENYLNLKLEELELRCGYITMKQREKEEQQRIKEQMREEERVRKELEAEEKKVEKEEQHFMNEINKLQKRMAKENEEQQAILLKQIEELQTKLAEVSEVKADIMNRRLNNKAGYVYVISNKGSFGENVYKIGVTRRLDPQVRVDELSSASVPFKYDVNAMIFSDDAFDLENKLHQMFDDKRVNLVNKHKEFFNVSIDEIEKAVKENFNETVEFNKTILNEEYVLSLSMKCNK